MQPHAYNRLYNAVQAAARRNADPLQKLLNGDLTTELFVSSLTCASREVAKKLTTTLIAHVRKQGAIARTQLAFLYAMGAILSPDGMMPGQHAQKVRG